MSHAGQSLCWAEARITLPFVSDDLGGRDRIPLFRRAIRVPLGFVIKGSLGNSSSTAKVLGLQVN